MFYSTRELIGPCRQISGTLVPAWQCLQGFCSAFRAQGNTLNKVTSDFGMNASFHSLHSFIHNALIKRQWKTFLKSPFFWKPVPQH